jgi:hypothetical protein
MVADSLCPARKERTICETEFQIEHSGSNRFIEGEACPHYERVS